MKTKTTKTAYKQIIKHFNEFPSALTRIQQVNTLGQTKYDPNLPPVTTIEEMEKRPTRFSFSVYLKNTSVSALPSHFYVFDDKKSAEKAYKHCMRQWIDEQLEPYRELVKKGKSLSMTQIERCREIQELLPED